MSNFWNKEEKDTPEVNETPKEDVSPEPAPQDNSQKILEEVQEAVANFGIGDEKTWNFEGNTGEESPAISWIMCNRGKLEIGMRTDYDHNTLTVYSTKVETVPQAPVDHSQHIGNVFNVIDEVAPLRADEEDSDEI